MYLIWCGISNAHVSSLGVVQVHNILRDMGVMLSRLQQYMTKVINKNFNKI